MKTIDPYLFENYFKLFKSFVEKKSGSSFISFPSNYYTDEQEGYVRMIYEMMINEGIRTELDTRNEKLGLKIREGIVKKVPYMVISGKKEMEAKTITVRVRDGSELKDVSLEAFINRVKEDNIFRR